MATRCDVCGEYPIRGAVRTFFPWPTDPSQRTYWQTCLGVQDLNLNKPELFICSDHFDQMQMIRKGTALRKDAFPKRYDGPLPTFLEEDGAPKVEPPSEDVKNEDVGIFDDPGPSAPVFDDEEIMPEELSMAKLVQMFAAAAKERPTTIAPFVTPISEETRAFSNILIDRQEKYLETYCKSCLRQAELVNMLEANCEGVPVTLMYKAVFMTEITPSDVPQLMCHTCIGLLFQCFKFSTMSARSCEVLQAARERFKYLSPLDDGTIDLKNIPDKYSAKPCPRPESDVEDQKDDVKVVKRSVKKRKSVVKSKEVPPEKKGRRTSTRRASEQAKKVSKKILEDSDEDDSNNDNFDNDEADPDFDAQEVKDESPEVSDAEVEEKEEDKDDQDPEDNYCMLCRHQFSNMARHMDKVHRVDWESKSCERCYHLPHSTGRELFKHLKSEHQGVHCTYCYMEYSGQTGLDRHLKLSSCKSLMPRQVNRMVKEPKTYICNVCTFDSTSFKQMFCHMEKVHSDTVNCIFCEKKFLNKFRLLCHIKNHGHHVYCANHFKAFDTPEELSAHFKVPGHDLECGACFQVFKSKAAKYRHRRSHAGRNKNKPVMSIKCPQCPLLYSSRVAVRRHLKTFHERSVQFLCEDCGASYSTNYALQNHRRKCQGKPTARSEQLYQCELCGFDVNDKKTFMLHRARHYEFSCEYCLEPFNDAEKLKEHEEAANHQWFYCEKCPEMKYRMKSALHMHTLRVHDKIFDEIPGKRPRSNVRKPTGASRKQRKWRREKVKWPKLENGNYYCKICQKEFQRMTSISKHMDLHSGTPKYKCHCGKQFFQEQTLKAHYSVHSNDRPHVCQTCGKSFKERCSFYKHRKVHGYVPKFKGGRPKEHVTYHPSFRNSNTSNESKDGAPGPRRKNLEPSKTKIEIARKFVVVKVPKKIAVQSSAAANEHTNEDLIALENLNNEELLPTGSNHRENESFYRRWTRGK